MSAHPNSIANMQLRTTETEKQSMIANLETSFEEKKAECLKNLEFQLQCSVCKQLKDRIVELNINRFDPYRDQKIVICEQCVKNALSLFGEAKS